MPLKCTSFMPHCISPPCYCRRTVCVGKQADRERYIRYSLFCYGFPVLATVLVVVTDRIMSSKLGSSTSWVRPGFGEEACWFTSCSQGLTLFLYG